MLLLPACKVSTFNRLTQVLVAEAQESVTAHQ